MKTVTKIWLLLLVCVFSSSLVLRGQTLVPERPAGGFAFTLGLGTALPSGMVGYKHFAPRLSLSAEGRYAFSNLPVDVGLQLGLASFERSEDPLYGLSSRFDSAHLLLVSDWNRPLSEEITFFAGVGLGFALHHNVMYAFAEPSYLPNHFGYSHGLCFATRVGLELKQRVRLTLGHRLQKKENSLFEASLGISFGGRRR